jgi:hypothetical protein
MRTSTKTLAILVVLIFSTSIPTIVESASINSAKFNSLQETQDFNFIAYGDTRSPDFQGVSPVHESIVNAYLQQDPELILHTGDMVG